MASTPSGYPANLTVDYKEKLDRLTTFFRIITIIPIAIVLSLLVGGTNTIDTGQGTVSVQYAGVGIIILPLILMIVFRQKYPRWWYDWNLQLTRFSTRVSVYALLLRDEYPSTDEEQALHLDFVYPEAKNDLNRWLPLIKWLLAIPHYIVLIVLSIIAILVVIVAWFAILITGSYPRALFDYVVGVLRYGLRVAAYAILLVTDRYPPFSLSE